MKKLSVMLGLALVFAAWSVAAPAKDKEKDEEERLENAGKVMGEILDVPDDIPQDLLDKARCVVVLPSVLKAAFVVGGSYGRGVMVCRTGKNFGGPWGAPAMYALEGGSVGFQIGGEATDFVILVMNDRGMDSLLHSKVKLGGDASVAAGPKGRTASAESDAYLRAEMLSYSRSRGAFAGISLEGTTLRPDHDANNKLYGKGISAAEIIAEGKVQTPEAGRKLVSRLQQASPKLRP
jgi:SH3 domain-containing YSC84-like protein 1